MTDKKRLQIKIDEQLNEDVNAILDDLGMTPTSVITALYKRIRASGSIPFDLKLTEREMLNHHFLQVTENIPEKQFVSQEEMNAWLLDDDHKLS